MRLIPMPKTVTLTGGECVLSKAFLASVDPLPPFVMAAVGAFFPSTAGEIPVKVVCGSDADAEGYQLSVDTRAIRIDAAGYRGVYYALQTLTQLREGDALPCVMLEDAPDYAYRGFYQDVSRGRIPTVATVKRLIDRLSALKMNSLQLYIEHTHRFAEYSGINEELGFYTDDDIRELDRYAKEHCVELVPSLSSFGHLYELLQSPQYRHLCELENYTPAAHNWHERLLHHTIDPSNPESLALLTRLISQYLPLFSSRLFNICCDETFDLCKGKNAGGDVAVQYAGFVSKLVAFLQARGKTVMMWSDIVMKHPEALSLLPEGIVYLNWCYDMNGNGLQAELLESHGQCQIVCPSVHSHKRLVEKIVYNRPNIRAVLESGLAHGAVGMLNTNWGDYGHLCTDEAMLYGMAYGAAKSWNVHMDEEAFDSAVCHVVYRSPSTAVTDILKTLGECDEIWFEREGYEMALWELAVQMFDRTSGIPESYAYRLEVLRANDLDGKRAAALSCSKRLRAMLEADELDGRIGEALLLAARGIAAIFGVLIDRCNGTNSHFNTLLDWVEDYKARWFADNQSGEWMRIEEFFTVNLLSE